MSSRRRLVFVTLPLAVIGAWAAMPERTADASGFLTDQFGNDQGNPGMANVYSIYFNPAAMGGVEGSVITVDGVLALRNLKYDRPASALSPSSSNASGDPDYIAANTGKAHLDNVLSAPFAGFVTDFGGLPLHLGVAVYVPFGGEVSWAKNNAFANSSDAPGGYDGSQRWASISATSSSIYSTVALAYRLQQARLSFGASFSAIRSSDVDVRARNVDGSDDIQGNGNTLKEGRSYLNVSGWEVGVAAGVFWEATPDGALRLGASYTSQPNFGTFRMKGTFDLDPISPGGTPADLLQAYPDVVRAGAAWRLSPRTEVRLDGNWQRWSQFKYQCIVDSGTNCNANSQGVTTAGNVKLDLPRDFKDSFKLRAGAAYWALERTELFASAAFETTPVNKSHEDALIYDSTRLEGTLGVRQAFNKHISASLAYTFIYLLPVTVNDSAYSTYSTVSKSPSTNGTYSSNLNVFDVAVSYRF